MTFDMDNLKLSLKTHYDKIVAFIVLLILLASAVILAVQVGMKAKQQRTFETWMKTTKPTNPDAPPVDKSDIEKSSVELNNPFTMPLLTNRMMTAEKRVSCIDCGSPTPYFSTQCVFCRRVFPDTDWTGPIATNADMDKDKLKDQWEKKYGFKLSREDPDTDKDPDGDQFTNQQEHDWNPQTDPTDPKSHPPFVAFMELEKLIVRPFHLIFMSSMGTGSNMSFGINLRREQTFFRKMGQEVGGFKIVGYEKKSVKVKRGGMEIDVDISILTLEKDGQMIPLTKGKRVNWPEYLAILLFRLDNKLYNVKKGIVFAVRGKNYQVISIDSEKQTVLIRDVESAEENEIKRLGVVKEPAVKSSLSSPQKASADRLLVE